MDLVLGLLHYREIRLKKMREMVIGLPKLLISEICP